MKGWNLDIKSSLSTTMIGMRDKGHLGGYVSMNEIRESYKHGVFYTNHRQFYF